MQKIIDPQNKFFTADKSFSNRGDITGNSKKTVSNLRIEDPDVLKHLVIVDDQIEVWEFEQQGNILPSKKFSPI